MRQHAHANNPLTFCNNYIAIMKVTNRDIRRERAISLPPSCEIKATGIKPRFELGALCRVWTLFVYIDFTIHCILSLSLSLFRSSSSRGSERRKFYD